jgi:hypothetical protein
MPPAVLARLESARKDQRVGQIARGPIPPLLCPEHVSRCKLFDRPIVGKAVSDQRVISRVWGREVFAAIRVDGHQHPGLTWHNPNSSVLVEGPEITIRPVGTRRLPSQIAQVNGAEGYA